jgi:hypothetical protein
MKTIVITGTDEQIELLQNVLKHDARLPQVINNEGTILTTEFLLTRGFKRDEREDYGGDKTITWINDGGITIYEEEWPSDKRYPFSFAVYVKGDGSFKSGYGIHTEEQLNNLCYSLSGRNLEVVQYY